MEIEALFICNSARKVDGRDTFDMVFNVIDVLYLPAIDSFWAIGRLRYTTKEFGEHNFVFDIVSPSGKSVIRRSGKYDVMPPNELGFPVGFTIDTLIVEMNVTFVEYGVHNMVLTIDNKRIGTFPIIIPMPINHPN